MNLKRMVATLMCLLLLILAGLALPLLSSGPAAAQGFTAPSVAAGCTHTVGLKADGTVVAVGRNNYGQLNVGNWTGIVQVSADVEHTVGLKVDGTVVAVGRNNYGQSNVGGWTGIIQVTTGGWHAVGLKSDGTVVAVGDNTYGQCNVGGWTGIIQVAAGAEHTAGLKVDGTVVALGLNDYGQLNVGNWTGIVQVSAGYDHTVGVKADGTVVAAGRNDHGQLNVGGWTGIVQIAAGYLQTVGLKANGTVAAVGDNDYGQCNVGSWTGIIQVSAGYYHTVGLKSDGTVVAVGANWAGQCNVAGWTGINQPMVAAGWYHTVGLKSDGTVVAVGWNYEGQCDVSGWTDIVQVAAGGGHTVGLKPNGTVVAVGYNGDGQCNVGGWRNITQVAAGWGHTVGVKDDGTVVAEGHNVYGQCDVSGWNNITQVAGGWYHTVGRKSDGTVVAVGWNQNGQCNVGGWTGIVQVAAGNYHTVGVCSNGTVVAAGCYPPTTQCNVGNWTDIVQVGAGNYHTVGLKSDGKVVAVGWNQNGQCNVGNWTDITQISAGLSHTVGLKSDGTVVAVGWNQNGQCNVGGWNLAPPNQPPNQPSNISPADEATDVSLTPVLQSSAFSDPNPGDTHAASQWQIREATGNYSTPVFDSGTNATNLTSITIPPDTLSYGTTYYWHVRHQDNHGAWSAYSSETYFTTVAEVEAGSVSGAIYEQDGTTLVPSATISAYDFVQGTLVAEVVSSNGTCTMVGLPAGDYKVRASCSGYVNEWYQEETSLDKADRVRVEAGQDTPNIDFTLSRVYVVSPPPPPENAIVNDSLYSGAIVEFHDLTGPTQVSINLSHTNPGSQVIGFKFLGDYYYIDTNPPYGDSVTVTLSYDDADVTGKEDNLKLFHFVDGEPQKVPDAVVDTVNNTITGTADTLSWFAIAEPDIVPPAAVTDLATGDATASSITLTWTAPGDDGNVGTASQYDIRYSASNITEANWDDSATQCTGEPSPQPAGSSESFVVTGLSPRTTYYFALKTADEVSNWSGLSNVPSETTGGCFIATAAYGTPMAEEIEILREFRDGYLLTNPVGQALVDFYYKVSPPMAEFITEHPSLKPIVRTGLVPAVAMSTVVINTTPAEKMAMVGLLALVSVALAIWAKRRRGRCPEYT